MTVSGAGPISPWSGRRTLVGSDNDQFRMPLRGRAWESGVVEQAIRDVEAGASRTLVFRGVAGVGKTRLLGEILKITGARGWGSLVAVPEPDSHLLPAAVLVDAALAASPPLLSSDEIRPLSGDADSRYWLAQSLCNALESATTQRSVVVLVDDLHWVDSASLAIIRSLLANLTDVPILWVFAIRTGDYGPAVGATLAGSSTETITVTVDTLPDDAVEQMAADLLGAMPDAPLRNTLRRAENLPLLVTELVQGLVEENLVTVSGATASANEAAVPERFGTSIRQRIDHLPKSTSLLVQVASTLGRTFTITNLAELLGAGTIDLMRGLDEAINADIFSDGSPLQFRHDAIRETAESMLSPSMRTYLRRQAADIRLRSGEPLLAVASSVADAAGKGDTAAVVLLHDAALQLAASDASGAARLATRAVELTASTDQDSLLAELIPVLWVGGLAEEAKVLALRLCTTLEADDVARVQLAVARLETESSFADAIRTCNAALSLEGISADVRALLMAVRVLNLANLGDHTELAGSLEGARDVAVSAGNLQALATINATESVLRFYQHRFDDASALIAAAAEQMTQVSDFTAVQWLPEGLWAAFLANSIGDCRWALGVAETNVEEAGRVGSAIAMAYWTMVRTRVLFDLGELDEAKMHAEAVLAMADQLGLGDFAQATAGVILYRVALHKGDFAACQARSSTVHQMADGVPLHLTGTWLLALTAVADGKKDEALALTTDAFETLDAPIPSMTTPADFSDDAELARLWARSGAVDRLARLGAVTQARSNANPRNDFVRGINEQVHGIIAGSPEQLQLAVSLLRKCERPLPLAAALEDLGRALRDTGNPSADLHWHEAADIYEQCGATRDAGRVLKLLREGGVRRRPKALESHRGVLSSRERDVAERLARGSTTKQVASDLSVAQSTVITHVKHIYEKWGISSRKALADRVLSAGAGPRP